MVDERSTQETTLGALLSGVKREPPPASVPALVVAWSRKEPHRVGEAALLLEDQIFGRGGPHPDDELPKVELVRQRPGANHLTPPVGSLRISRAQLRLRPRGERVEVESLGLCALHINGEPAQRGEVGPGDTLHLEDELVFVVVQRPPILPLLRYFDPAIDFPFGAADPFGIVGESPAAWRLRDELAFVAAADGHVLVRGESGVGKELAASAVHRLSPRGARPLIARSAATFPEGLVDAELFGNAKNYPNPGTPEREGLIGEADGSSLFLDEIGELPERLQAHLLRVLDRNGEYHRLGEGRARRADLRMIAATNRRLDELKHDVAARFTQRVDVPPLTARCEDVPLLFHHLLRRAAEKSPRVGETFFAKGAGARVDPLLIERLVRHPYRLHSRELEELLWQALRGSSGEVVLLTEDLAARLGKARPSSPAPLPPPSAGRLPPLESPEPSSDPAAEGASSEEGRGLTRAEVEACLLRTGGNVSRAARELGFKNRYALYRLMRRLDLGAPPLAEESRGEGPARRGGREPGT